MNHSEYRAMRKSMGSQREIAKILNIPLSLLISRESGKSFITREAELALELLSELAKQQPQRWNKSLETIREGSFKVVQGLAGASSDHGGQAPADYYFPEHKAC